MTYINRGSLPRGRGSLPRGRGSDVHLNPENHIVIVIDIVELLSPSPWFFPL